MRLDAAKLRECFGSWFLRRACYPVKQSANSERPEEPASRRVFSFLAFTLLRQGIEDLALDPEKLSKTGIIRGHTAKPSVSASYPRSSIFSATGRTQTEFA